MGCYYDYRMVLHCVDLTAQLQVHSSTTIHPVDQSGMGIRSGQTLVQAPVLCTLSIGLVMLSRALPWYCMQDEGYPYRTLQAP